MLDYKDLNDNEKRILREQLGVERMTQFYLEDHNILLMNPNEMFEYIFLDEIHKLNEAINLINDVINMDITQNDVNKTIRQKVIESHDSVSPSSEPFLPS